MKHFVFLIGLAALTAFSPGPADAQQRSSNMQLIRSVQHGLDDLQLQVDASTLSVSQLAALHALLNASSLSNGERRARALSVLGGMDVLFFGRNVFGG